MKSLELHAKEIRRNIIELAHRSKGPHVGSSLSCADILTALYFDTMKLAPWKDRDIFIMSKAHAASALYSTLVVRGIIRNEDLVGVLPGHLVRFHTKGIEVSAGSLGHGFSIGLGMAYGLKRKDSEQKVFVLIGDGESQEGSVWEGALFAPKLGLDNFTAIMDYNNLQGYGKPVSLCNFEPVKLKWEAFGWDAREVDGHDMKSLRTALHAKSRGKPRIIIAHTVKGKGISFMENELVWHYYVVSDQHRDRALKELA